MKILKGIIMNKIGEKYMENKIELTPFQYTSYWWITRMKSFVEDVINVGYSTDEGVDFTQIFDCLKAEHWRALYLKLTPLIEEDYNKNGKFIQSTKSTCNDHYVGHDKVNEMLKSIIHVDIPNATLNPTGTMATTVSLLNKDGIPTVFLHNDDETDIRMIKADLNVEKDYILTGDKSLLPEEKSL